MNFVNKTMTQVGDLFRSMTPGMRITAGLLLVLVVVSVSYLFRFPSNAPNDFLFGGRPFSSSELATMEAAFSTASLNDYEIEGNRIRIPRSQRSTFVRALAENQALPQDFDTAIVGEETQSHLWESSEARRDRIERARQRELAMAIRGMPGIENATVQIDEASVPGFRRRTEVTAMVGLVSRGSGSIDPQTIETIRELVSAAKAGLSSEHVTVTDLSSGIAHPGGGEHGPVSSSRNVLYTWTERYEAAWFDKAREVLSFIPGVRVAVNVVLDPTIYRNQDSLTYDPKATTYDSQSESRSETSRGGGGGGRVGVSAQNGPNTSQEVASGGAESEVEQSQERIRSIPSPRREQAEELGLVPERVTFSVSVPDTYYQQIYKEHWLETNELGEGEEVPAPTDAEITALESQTKDRIENALVILMPGVDPTEDNYPKVSVTTFPVLPGDIPELPGMTEKATGWLSANWQVLGVLLIGGFSLVMLRGLVRGGPASSTTSEVAESSLQLVDQETTEEGDSLEGDGTAKSKRRFASNGPNPKEDLAELVREDPDTAASILRSWIGEAA